MCRVLSYLGQPILLDDLLYKPNNSLITQSYDPKFMTHMLNLAGFGFIAWDYDSFQSEIPFLYRTHSLPFYDENLKNIASKVRANCIIAHTRGVEYSEKNIVSNQNVHPFKFSNTSIAFAHNGTLVGFEEMRLDILCHIKKEYQKLIRGTTDTESMYALFLSQLDTAKDTISIDDVFAALIETLKILDKLRKKHHISISSPLNFFISNSEFIVATRFVFDYGRYPSSTYSSPHMGYQSMWYTYGEQYGLYNDRYEMKTSDKMKSIIISSEPLTEDSTTWIELPEYSFIGATLVNEQLVIRSMDILV